MCQCTNCSRKGSLVTRMEMKEIIGHTDGDERDLQDLYCSFQKFTLSIPDGPDGMQKLPSQ